MADAVALFTAEENPSMEGFNRRIREVNALAEQLGSARGGGPYYATCATAGSTTAKVAVCEGFTLKTGAAVIVKFTYYNTATSPTLNVNGTGAKYIKKYGTTGGIAYMWYSGEMVQFVYDGANWVMTKGMTATTTYYGLTKLSSSVSSTSTTEAATPSAVKQAYDLASAAASKAYVDQNIRNALAKIVTVSGLSTGSENVKIYPHFGSNIPDLYELSYGGVGRGDVKIAPPKGYAFTNLVGTYIPYANVNGSLKAGETSDGLISFGAINGNFSFQSGEGHSYVLLCLEVA